MENNSWMRKLLNIVIPFGLWHVNKVFVKKKIIILKIVNDIYAHVEFPFLQLTSWFFDQPDLLLTIKWLWYLASKFTWITSKSKLGIGRLWNSHMKNQDWVASIHNLILPLALSLFLLRITQIAQIRKVQKCPNSPFSWNAP